jgi:hypothetical protein
VAAATAAVQAVVIVAVEGIAEAAPRAAQVPARPAAIVEVAVQLRLELGHRAVAPARQLRQPGRAAGAIAAPEQG